MQVIEVRPRGYCHGVVSALKKVRDVLADPSYPRPIYILGQIVHNRHVTRSFKKQGVIHLYDTHKTPLELIDRLFSGTIIFSAHGVSDQIINRARENGLTIVNAVCEDVSRVHDIIRMRLAQGYRVFYIGHKGHPEPEAILSIDPSIIMIETARDALLVSNHDASKKIFVTNQTTLSAYDVDPIVEIIKSRFQDVLFDNEICQATTMRQEAVKGIRADLLIVIGDAKSSNTNRLVKTGMRQDMLSKRIDSLDDLDLSWLENVKIVAVTSGASTPTRLTSEVIAFLKAYDPSDPATWKRSRSDKKEFI